MRKTMLLLALVGCVNTDLEKANQDFLESRDLWRQKVARMIYEHQCSNAEYAGYMACLNDAKDPKACKLTFDQNLAEYEASLSSGRHSVDLQPLMPMECLGSSYSDLRREANDGRFDPKTPEQLRRPFARAP